jgi:hypothetical protein
MVETSDSAKGFWAKCENCKIDLPPHNQVIDRQRKGEPVAQGYLCGKYGNEYYLCGACLTKIKGIPYANRRPSQRISEKR